jgi:hypothetical protein
MMRRPQWAASRINGLDRIIHRFQDRWETNRQFRAMLSGLLGLVMIVALCSCMGVVTTVANTALAGVSAARDSTGNSGNSNTGMGPIKGIPTFPTSTVPPWQPGSTPPYSIIPNSQTPVPSATVPPTATPSPTSGGGGPPATCNGNQGANTWALDPCPQVHGQGGTLTIVATKYPNASLNIVLSLGSCNACTFLFTPAQGYKLDASGKATITYTVPAGAANSTVPISGMINIGGGPTLSIYASPTV